MTTYRTCWSYGRSFVARDNRYHCRRYCAILDRARAVIPGARACVTPRLPRRARSNTSPRKQG